MGDTWFSYDVREALGPPVRSLPDVTDAKAMAAVSYNICGEGAEAARDLDDGWSQRVRTGVHGGP